jgi:hypothetical protein
VLNCTKPWRALQHKLFLMQWSSCCGRISNSLGKDVVQLRCIQGRLRLDWLSKVLGVL